jgi:uncharacterized protein YjdB
MTGFSCTEGNAGPILDLVWGGLNVLGAIAIASDPEYYGYESSGQVLAIGLGWGVVSGLSANAGFNKTKQCRTALRQLSERSVRPAPQGVVAPTSLPSDLIVQAVSVNPPIDTLVPGERAQLVATARNSSGAAVANRLYVWSSSNDAIASVSASGLVTANAAGTVVVAARTGDVVGISSILVVARR